MYFTPQINLYSSDVPRAMRFYEGLGFTETFRYAPDGEPVHVEYVLDGFKLGIASVQAARDDHGLDPNLDGRAIEIVLWCDDTDRAYAELLAAGAEPLAEPHDWLEDLRIAWVADPDGHSVQLAQKRA